MPAYPISTTVQLCSNIPLSRYMPHRINFLTRQDRESYFAQHLFYTDSQIQLQRIDGIYRLPLPLDDALHACNYMRWTNKSGKYYYAFITNLEYINPNLTRVEFEIDAWTTFQFDLNWGDCFIERECVSSDYIGEHTLPENLTLGPIRYSAYPDNIPIQENGNVKLLPAIFVTEPYRKPSIADEYSFNRVINNLPQSLIVWSGTRRNSPSQIQGQLNMFLETLADLGKLDAIVSATYMPAFAFDNATRYPVISAGEASPIAGFYYSFPSGLISTSHIQQIDVKYNMASYNNNKMYTHPFNTFYLTNNNGDKIDLLPQHMAVQSGTVDYSKRKVVLVFRCDISPTPSLTAYPIDYQGGGLNTHASVLQNFPQMATSGDAFSNWRAGHAATIATGIITNTLAIPGQMLLSSGMASAFSASSGIISNGVTGIRGSINQLISIGATMADKEIMPNTIQTLPGNTGNYAAQKLGFSIIHGQITAEFGYTIDNYFSIFGYKVNRMGTPEFRTRKYWNFYKIPACNLYGDIPSRYIEEIREMFITGITLWNDKDVGNYHAGKNPILEV